MLIDLRKHKRNMNKKTRNILLAIAAIIPTGNVLAQIPDGYYDALKGKKGAELKTAVHDIIKDANVLNYGSGAGATWWGFYLTDNDNGYVIDRYSNNSVKFGSQGTVASGMNIEHSFPKSWWGGSKNQAYQDLYNLMPSNSNANSSKSNYGMGVVTDATYDNGCIKVGMGDQGFRVWQPSTEWQGDFSRSYMYMATAYQNLTWTSEGLNSLEQGDYPTLKPWAYKLYIKWCKEDPVSKTEIARNEAVYRIQGNRNPYIDFPNLMEYIWGDSIDYAFNPATTVKSAENNGGDGGDVTPGMTETVIYSANYHSADGDCVTTDIAQPQTGIEVWQRSSSYGWKATSTIKNSSGTYVKYNAEGTLALPEMDLAGYSSASLSFTHMLNYCTSPDDYLSVEVQCEGNVAKLSGFTWPAGTKWTSVESGEVSLDQYVGKKIQILFRYTGTTSVSATWEIEKAVVTGKKTTTGINVVDNSSNFDSTKPYEVFDLSGKCLSQDDARRGVVIVKQGGKTFKKVMK